MFFYFLVMFFSCSLSAKISISGGETDISDFLSNYINEDVEYSKYSFNRNDIYYIDVSTASTEEIEYVKSQIVDGKLVIIDLRNILSEDTRVMHSQFLTGLGVSSPIIVSGIYRGEFVVNMISSEVTDQNNQSIDIPEAENYSLEQSLKHVLKRFDLMGKVK
ncbi:cytolysin secretion protein [Vibrio caribbeanicus]|nr:cytolysin secretion protein [Vibrio caribbeanicus]